MLMKENGSAVRQKVLIPYIKICDVAEHLEEWQELSKSVEFVRYRVTDVEAFKRFFKESNISCLWVTDEFAEHLGGPSEFWDFYPDSLLAIVVPWVGCDFIDGQRLRNEKNITLCNIGPNAADSVAELALFLVIGCFRLTSFWEHCFRFATHGNVNSTRTYIGGERGRTADLQWQAEDATSPSPILPKNFPEILDNTLQPSFNLSKNFVVGGKPVDSPTGKNALILGFGSIGQAIGKRLFHGLAMNIHYYKRSGPVPASNLEYQATFCSDLNSADTWAIADIVIISLPSNPSTINIINEDTLAMCKKGVRIVNVGRGSCIDEDALIRALDSGKVASCGLDVFQNENTGVRKDLLNRWDVTLLPHIGSAVSDMIIRQNLITLKNIKSILIDGERGIYPIN